MKYQELKNKLNSLTEEQLSQTVLVYDYTTQDQFMIQEFEINPENEFDSDQPVLTFY